MEIPICPPGQHELIQASAAQYVSDLLARLGRSKVVANRHSFYLNQSDDGVSWNIYHSGPRPDLDAVARTMRKPELIGQDYMVQMNTNPIPTLKLACIQMEHAFSTFNSYTGGADSTSVPIQPDPQQQQGCPPPTDEEETWQGWSLFAPWVCVTCGRGFFVRRHVEDHTIVPNNNVAQKG
jgi:hypothetical protein